MKVAVKNESNVEIEVGDIVVCSDNRKYLLIKNTTGSSHPYTFVDLETCQTRNGFSNLQYINENRYVSHRQADIKRVIKAKNLELREV